MTDRRDSPRRNRPYRLWAAGLPVLLAACPSKTPPEAPEAPVHRFSAAAYVGDSTRPFAYLDHTAQGPSIAVGSETAEGAIERCRAAPLPEGAPELDVHNVRICATSRPDAPDFETLYATHAVGDVYFGYRLGDAPWTFHPPKVAVPLTFDVGNHWAARHTTESGDHLRRCEAVPSPWCDDGVAIECVTFKVHSVTWVKNHWCPAHGQVGYDGVVVKVGRAPFWSWSTSPRRAGVDLPDLPLDQRPFPDVAPLVELANALTPDRIAALSADDARLPE